MVQRNLWLTEPADAKNHRYGGTLDQELAISYTGRYLPVLRANQCTNILLLVNCTHLEFKFLEVFK